MPKPGGQPLDIVIIGLSITSSWGNGHATTYRALMRALDQRGHRVLFLERDVPWYAENRDLPMPPYGKTALYRDLAELRDRYAREVARADFVMVGSFVPQGVEVGRWVTATAGGRTAFYDIDTPITMAKLKAGDFEYLHPDLIPRYDLYLSFTGGSMLAFIEQTYGALRALPLYCSVDPEHYQPQRWCRVPERKQSVRSLAKQAWDLGYMGTYSQDRQPAMELLLMEPARRLPEHRFMVAGPQYPEDLAWPVNVRHISHLAPCDHASFYSCQRFTLNVTRRDMRVAGYSPSVRLFEAAACGTPIISDPWEGLETFFALGSEILVAQSAEDICRYLTSIGEDERVAMGARARARVLAEHTAAHRAIALEAYLGLSANTLENSHATSPP